jgi:hypothetical protein
MREAMSDKTPILNECLDSQKRAGFKFEDRRKVTCRCGASGYNTGWGWWRFECGAEVLSDGNIDVPCSKTEAADALVCAQG